MADEPNETRAFYKAIADFAAIKRELRDYRRDLAKTKAAEDAFNAQAIKRRQEMTDASKKRAAALKSESSTLAKAVKQYADLAAAQSKAAEASKKYTAAQKKTVNDVGTSKASTRALREEKKALDELTESRQNSSRAIRRDVQEKQKASRSTVRFVEDVGHVVEATGEVVDATEKAAKATSFWGNALTRSRSYFRDFFTNTAAVARAQQALNTARERQVDAAENVRVAELRLSEAMKHAPADSARVVAAQLRLERARRVERAATEAATDALSRYRRESSGLPPIQKKVERGAGDMYRAFQRFGNWRPRLVPPFVALIPIIGAVIAAINPLVAILGSLGPLVLGLASSIGSLSGAFLALPGILSAVVSGLASVIASFGGVGKVFKAYGAMQKALGKSGASGGQSQADRSYELAKAEYNLAKAQKNVQKAQERLNDAREQAIEDLKELRQEVSRAGMDEERAVANLRKAQEEYWNVMADPGSTLGDKLDAAVSIKEAEADLQDVRETNLKNQKALNEAESKGVENADRVVDAQENLTDAIWAQRDAQRALRQEQGGGSSVAQATNEYADALAKLSPSARAFALAIIGMKDQWEAFQRTIQESFFSQFVNELDRLPRILQSVETFLRPAAVSMGQFARNFLLLLDSPEWQDDLATIGEQNGRVLDEMGRGGLAFADALRELVVAAGPFTEWLVGGLADGLENFRDLVATGRESGSLASWLDKVAGRLSKWWDVIRNIGSTLFNYSAAASDFGDWILDNLVEMTAGWAESAKAARDEGSPFQKWLEDVKPLLSEVNGLFGDFFGWFREQSMDPANIQDATDLVKIIRDDLGPALGDFLDALSDTEIDEKFVETLSSIVDSLTTIMENGGGASLETFFDVVEGFFQFLEDVVSNIDPNVLQFVLQTLGTLAGLTFVGKFTGLTNLIGSILGLGTDSVAFKGVQGIYGYFKGMDKLKFKSLIGAGGLLTLLAVGVAANAQAIADSFATIDNVNKANDRGDWQGAIGEGVKDGGLIKGVAGPVVNFGAISNVLGMFDSVFGTKSKEQFDSALEDRSVDIFNFAMDVKRNWDSVAATLVGGAMFLHNNFVVPMQDAFNNAGSWFDSKLVQPIQRGWQAVQDFLAYGWFWIQEYVILPFRMGLAVTADWVDKNFVQPVQRYWQDLQRGLVDVWNWINTYVFLPFQNGLSTLRSWFDNGVRGIGETWDRLRNSFAEPIRFVVNTVYNNGIRKFWNGVNDALKLNMPLNAISLPFKEGGVLPGYTPGRDVHEFYSPTGGRLSLSGGEAIMRPEFTKAVGGKKGVDALNRKARNGEKFASGGVYGGSQSHQRFASGGILEFAGDIWDQFSSFFKSPVQYVTNGINNIISPWLDQLTGQSPYGNLVSGIPKAAVSQIAGVGQTVANRSKRSTPVGGPGMGWEAQWAAVKAAFPKGINLNSAYYDRIGGKTYHGKGRAIDVTPSMEVFNWIRENYPNSTELIYSPAGGRQLQGGKNYLWPEPVRSQHWDHVHWAMKNGGVIPGLFDNGGILNHGQLGINLTGKPEAVLDPEQTKMFRTLLSGSGLGGMNPLTAVPAGMVGNGGSQRVVDNSVNIKEYTVVNPVPERQSTSLPKMIRKTAYVNSARTSD